ncbi:hypothetical protein [Bizionia myxarmorum]|uniref:Uncharacterized protein n=1 Tax=Bizionia myxarmorum TaxID=291186 RepID=A0A5D0RBA9_9FLAO|nr:hypothetical protein [Bizionia myxarmorum]TYB78802.1 hypothetical protein ES674_03220 [Bizionia myxarmorum]
MTLQLESYLGNPIESLSPLVTEFEKITKTFKLCSEQDFAGMKYNEILVCLKDDKRIESIFVNFPFIITAFEYTNIISNYGSPDNCIVKDKLETVSKSDSFNQSLVKRNYSTKEVEFKDKPLCMLWNKNDYTLKIMFYYEQNGMQLIFSSKY